MQSAVARIPAGRLRGRDLARGLGWFSLALGTVELLAPRRLGDALGMDQRPVLVQACGLRELAAGAGLLAAADQRPWIWGRIGGDLVDLAGLLPGLSSDNPKRGAATAAVGAVAAVTAVDIFCATLLERERAARWRDEPARDYSDRSGFPRPPAEMRGRARHLSHRASSAQAVS